MIVAPAGVELHTHVAGAALNAARMLFLGQPDLENVLLPAASEAARRYLNMGYTTVMEAAMPSLLAWQTHADLEQMANLSRGAFTNLGDHSLLIAAAAKRDSRKLQDVIAWLLEITGGYAVKLVNPGAARFWKDRHPVPRLDDPIEPGGLTQRGLIQAVVSAANELGLPHPVHLHAGQLGIPGNWKSFCETITALHGERAHLCHIQFYCYGEDSHGRMTSEAARVADYLAQHPALTVDVGQVLFGPALAVTADIGAIGFLREQVGGVRYSRHLEAEGGGSLLPLMYLEKDASAAVQWAAGLELLLNFPDPTRMFLTVDHPNGGPFTAYPAIIHWLMNRDARREVLAKIHPAAREKTGLTGLTREYTLAEIFAMTSYGPAQALGLLDRGHLKPGSRADLRAYRKSGQMQEMFARPAWVMRAGEIVLRDGEPCSDILGDTSGCPPEDFRRETRRDTRGETLVVRPEWDRSRGPDLLGELGERLSFDPQHYGLQPWLAEKHFSEIACTSTGCG
jgi:formylmethanofuran dehydrogenase subunit A